MFVVIGTETYLQEIRMWPKRDKEHVRKIQQQLANNPRVGRPLHYPFLREKRVQEKRVYYLVYEDLRLVLLVATSDKKDQQSTIEHIKKQLDDFRIIAESIAKQVS